MPTDQLRKIASLAPPLYVMGGIAEDLLLRGNVVEGHRDLDMLVPVKHLGLAAEQLVSIGLAWVPHDDQPGRPWVFGANTSLPVEVWPCLTTASGEYFVVVPGSDGRHFRLELPSDTFLHAPREAGLKLHTVSPLALYRMRLASAQTRHEGMRSERDLAIAAKLRLAFLNDMTAVELTVTLEEL
jgi:hypothetical protein